MAKKIRLGLIGCGGNMQRAHLPRIQADKDVELACVVDPEVEQAEALMDRWGEAVARYDDHRQMARNESLDAVFVSTPHALHYEQVRLALQKGWHVLVEKPLTVSARQTKALIALADKHKRFLVVSYQRHYCAPYSYVREQIREGAIGELRGVVAYVTQRWGMRMGWRLDPALSGGGMFMDTGSHLVAATLWMTGLEPVEVSAFTDNSGRKVDINMVVNVRFKRGVLGTLNTFGGAGRHDERVAIHGSEGCIVFHLHQWDVKTVLLNDEPIKIPARIKDTTPDAELFRWMRTEGKGYGPPDFALQVARLSEAAYKSAERKRTVAVAR